MSLITCPECGKKISPLVQECPNCAYPIRKMENAQKESNAYNLVKENINTKNESQTKNTKRAIRTSVKDSDFYKELKKLPGFDSWGTKKEIKYLETMLYEDEDVFAIASGLMDNNTWLISCTNKRIIFVDCGMIYGVKHSEVMIDKINAISFKNGLIFGEIHIEDGASTRIIRNVQKYSTKPFVDAVHKSMEMSHKKVVPANSGGSRADEILKFKRLLDLGVISKAEFEQQKKKLLNL